MRLDLVKKRQLWWPTWKGWSLILLLSALVVATSLQLAYPLLAPTHRVAADTLVVEGWLPEYALDAAIDEFRTKGYQRIITSGGPLWEGHHASGYHSYADLATQVMTSIGADTNALITVPGPEVWRHRTFHSAQAVRTYLEKSDFHPTGINVMTLGPHGRRTSLIFGEALRTIAPVGIISFPSAEYDAHAWWRTSEGTKHIITEFMASTYEWLFASGRGK